MSAVSRVSGESVPMFALPAPVEATGDALARAAAAEAAASAAAVRARQAKEERDRRIAALKGDTRLEQELVDALRSVLALPAAAPLAAIREICSAVCVDKHVHKLRERAALVTLRTIASAPDDAGVADLRAFIERQLDRLCVATVKELRRVTEHLERQIADDAASPRAIFERGTLTWCMRVAAKRGFRIPISATSAHEAAWRAFWLGSLENPDASRLAPPDARERAS